MCSRLFCDLKERILIRPVKAQEPFLCFVRAKSRQVNLGSVPHDARYDPKSGTYAWAGSIYRHAQRAIEHR